MEELKVSNGHAVHPARRHHGAGDARGVRISRAGHGAQQEPGQRAGEDPVRLRDVDGRLFLRRLRGRLRRGFPRRGGQARGKERLRPRQVLLPAHVRCGGSGDRLRRYRRARAVRCRSSIATAVIVGFVYPFFEGIAWNDRYGVQAWLEASTGAKFHDFAGSVVVHAVGGWIALGGGHPAGPAHRPLPEGRQRHRAAAVEHSVPRARRVGAERSAGSDSTSCPHRRSTRSAGSSPSTR